MNTTFALPMNIQADLEGTSYQPTPEDEALMHQAVDKLQKQLCGAHVDEDEDYGYVILTKMRQMAKAQGYELSDRLSVIVQVFGGKTANA